MSSLPQVWCVIVFSNAAIHMGEAIESVLFQTYDRWQLLLVDAGSTDGSRDIAERYAARHEAVSYYAPGKKGDINESWIHLLDGIDPRGEYVAFLDPKDVWLSQKLEQQVGILEKKANAAMVYGSPLFWRSWRDKEQDRSLDYSCESGVQPETIVDPPKLIPILVDNQFQTALLSDVLVRREAWHQARSVRTGACATCEDSAWLVRIMMTSPVYVSKNCWTRCRVGVAEAGTANEKVVDVAARSRFLSCLAECLDHAQVKDPSIWKALDRQRENYAFDRIRRTISTAFPEVTVHQIAFLGEGLNSRAYRINGTYIFRFPKHAAAARALRLEIKLLERLRGSLSLPVPDFEYVANLQAADDRGRIQKAVRRLKRFIRRKSVGQTKGSVEDFMFRTAGTDSFVGYKEIPGSLLYPEFLLSLGAEDRARLARQLGTFLRSLHDFPLGKARRAGAKERRFDSAYYDRARSIAEAHVLPRLNVEHRGVIACLLSERKGAHDTNEDSPVLLHGDLNWSHLIFDERNVRIAGIIDFGEMFIGDPVYDFIELWRRYDEAFVKLVMEYYGAVSSDVYLTNVVRLHCAECLHRIQHAVEGGSGALPDHELQLLQDLALWLEARGHDAV